MRILIRNSRMTLEHKLDDILKQLADVQAALATLKAK